MSELTPQLAATFARVTLGHLGREYPHKLDHVMAGPGDARVPSDLHPIFHGSFDWHSCVHGWWQVLRIARLYPALPEAADVRARSAALFTPANVAVERAYLTRPDSSGFERPYGWAWALALHGELARETSDLADCFAPLAGDFATRFTSFLPKQTYPIRVGTHPNSSFAMTLAHNWAKVHDLPLAELVVRRAKDWFGRDQACQAWEPGGDEFLSSALTEALLMSRVMRANAFADWFDAFLPRAAQGEPATLFTPATVSDRSDGKIAHLDGLNLSRAWCWKGIAAALGADHPLSPKAWKTADNHIAAALPHIAGDYAGEHWLASFALLALQSPGEST